jgi:hypothetical protein
MSSSIYQSTIRDFPCPIPERGQVAFAQAERRTGHRSPMSLVQLRTAMGAVRQKRPMTDEEYRAMVLSFMEFAGSRRTAPSVSSRTGLDVNSLECDRCGHSESWQPGNYGGERTDFEHHDCGNPGHYVMCGNDCDHSFPGRALIPTHPSYNAASARRGRVVNVIDLADGGASHASAA